MDIIIIKEKQVIFIDDNFKKILFSLRDEIIKRYFNNLNEEQLKAVLAMDDAVLTIACPGAGKTQVIVNKIIFLTTFGGFCEFNNNSAEFKNECIKELKDYINNIEKKIPEMLRRDSVSSDNIVVITFTKMAAENMKDRFIKLCPGKPVPFFGTFHSLFYNIVTNHIGKISIISEKESYYIIRKTLQKYLDTIKNEEITGIINEISRLKSNKLFNIEYESKVDKKVFLHCYNNYENYKTEKNLMDYDDIIIKTIEIFQNDKAVLSYYRKKFKYILVDEFQDCDSSQIHLLKLFSKASKIFAVGDEDQCIYGFRGSRPECMVDFNKHFKDGKTYFLSKNYRSCRLIIDGAIRVISNNSFRNNKVMAGMKVQQGKIEFLQYKNEMDQAESVAKIILKMDLEDRHNTAVLYRTNSEATMVISNFIKYNIQFLMTDKNYNFFNNTLCKDILSYFKLSMDPFSKEDIIEIINKPVRYISKIKLNKIRNYNLSKNWFNFLMELPDMKVYELKNIDKFQKDMKKLKRLSPGEGLDFIINKIGYNKCLREKDMRIVKELKEILLNFTTIEDFLNYNDKLKEEIKAGVVLSTIHGAKGLEYKNVFIINCNKDNMPHLNGLSNIEEERRLFYVGITRAKEALWISYSERFKGNYAKVSPFVKEFSS